MVKRKGSPTINRGIPENIEVLQTIWYRYLALGWLSLAAALSVLRFL